MPQLLGAHVTDSFAGSRASEHGVLKARTPTLVTEAEHVADVLHPHLHDAQVLVVDGQRAQGAAGRGVDVPQANLRVVRARQQVSLPEAAPGQPVALQEGRVDRLSP